MAEETILLHFDIDEQPAVNSIKDLRSANSQLRAERDKVNIATKEGQELVQKLNVQIDKNNKLIKDNSSAIEKQRQNVGNYSKSIEEAAGNLNIMGTNVGSLTTQLSSFINPATAAVGIVSALGAAYANSTTGAKDLEFASNQLGSAINLLSNDFARLISNSEEGEGIVSKSTNFLIEAFGNYIARGFGTKLAAESKELANIKKQLDDLKRDEIAARSAISDRLADNQELLTEIQDSQTSYNDKISLTTQIISNLTANEDELLKVKNAQLALVNAQLLKDSENETLKTAQLELEREISNVTKDAERRRQAILRLESNITDTYRDQNELLRIQSERDKQKERDSKERRKPGSATGQIAGQTQIDSALYLSNALIKIEKDTQNSLNESRRLGTEYRKALIDSEIQIAQYYADALVNLSSIAGEQSELFKTAAIAQTIISTYTSATKSYDALSGIPFVGPALGAAAAAAAIANGLANVARISGVAAAGGADFVTTKPTMLIVGDNPGGRERVTVEPLSGKGKTRTFGGGVAMAGGGSLTVDPRFNDGGFVANQNMEASRQVMAFKNIVKNLPPVVASWSEGRAIGRQLEFKEKISKQ